MFRHAVLAACLALAACATVEPLGQERFDDRYRITGARWGPDSYLAIGYRAFEHGGKLALCGVYAPHLQVDRGFDPNEVVVIRGGLFVGETKALYDLSRFAKASPTTRDFRGATTRCLVTGLPWKPEYANATFHYEFVGPKEIIEM